MTQATTTLTRAAKAIGIGHLYEKIRIMAEQLLQHEIVAEMHYASNESKHANIPILSNEQIKKLVYDC